METEVAPRTRKRSRYADSWVFFEGEIVPYADAYLPPMTHALHRHRLLRGHSRLLE